MQPDQKLNRDIQKFLEVYRFMPAEEKARFIAELTAGTKHLDAKTQSFYTALLRSASDGEGVDAAVKRLTTLSRSSLE